MRCPTCKKLSAHAGNLYRPFCSERCKMIDLDNWLSGRYRISVPLDDAARQTPPVNATTEPDEKAKLD